VAHEVDQQQEQRWYCHVHGQIRGCAGEVEGRQAVHAGGTLLQQHLELVWEGEQGHKQLPEGQEQQLEEEETCSNS